MHYLFIYLHEKPHVHKMFQINFFQLELLNTQTGKYVTFFKTQFNIFIFLRALKNILTQLCL